MLLGELLVYRYRLITKEQQGRALERQREVERGRRLGEILIEMGFVTSSQLQDALDYQFNERHPWHNAA